MRDTSAFSEIPRRAAMSQSASQNAGSSDTLVACPAIRTDRFTMSAESIIAKTCAALIFLQEFREKNYVAKTRGLK